jgi:hypothetical protein
MKNILIKAFLSIITLVNFLQLAVSQSDAGFNPALSNIQGADFPKISADNSVYVRLKAPNTIKVQVQGGDGLCRNRLIS